MQHRLSYHISRCLMCPREYCRLILRMSIRSSVSSFGPNQLYLYGRCPADSSGRNQTRCSQGGNPKVLASDLVFHYCPKPSTKSHEGNSSAHQVFATASHSNGPAHAASTMCKKNYKLFIAFRPARAVPIRLRLHLSDYRFSRQRRFRNIEAGHERRS